MRFKHLKYFFTLEMSDLSVSIVCVLFCWFMFFNYIKISFNIINLIDEEVILGSTIYN